MEARASPLGPAPRSFCVPGQHRCVGIAIVRIPTLFTSNRLRANLCRQGEWSCILRLFPLCLLVFTGYVLSRLMQGIKSPLTLQNESSTESTWNVPREGLVCSVIL